MNQKDAAKAIKGKKHKQCCMTQGSLKRDFCAYFQKKVNPDAQACIQFVTCKECEKN